MSSLAIKFGLPYTRESGWSVQAPLLAVSLNIPCSMKISGKLKVDDRS